MESTLRIRPAGLADAEAISDIYNHYVRTSTCTFHEVAESPADRQRWLEEHTGSHVVLVAEEEAGTIVGWASLSRFHPRPAFRFTVEDSVYLRDDCRGRGLGGKLLAELMAHAARSGVRTVIAAISADQEASIALHGRFGFVEVGRLRAVGFKFGRWLDLVYMQVDAGKPA
jgi:phosphinothricin acetyltransferase